MRPAVSLARKAALQVRPQHFRPLLRPNVGCSYWVLPQARPYSAKPKPSKLKAEEPPVQIDDESFGADFFEEVAVDEGEPEWDGEEVQDGVFMSAMPASVTAPSSTVPAAAAAEAGVKEADLKEKKGPRTKHTIKHLNRLLSRHQVPDLDESELEERFVRGRGPGGQAINKTNSSVSLLHVPTGIRIQSQPTRSRAQNRVIARQILKERLDLLRARGQLVAAGIEPAPPAAVDPAGLSRKERLAAEARGWSKQELRWEKERRRKLNRKKKVSKRKNKGGDEAEETA